MNTYKTRRDRVSAKLKGEGIAAALFEDTEGARDQAIRYLTGQPGDSLLLVSSDFRSILVSWDLNMARKMASIEEVLAYSDFSRLPHLALAGMLERLALPKGSKIELPAVFAYPRFIRFVEALPDFDFVCREEGIGEFSVTMRAIKDEGEIARYRRAAKITDALMDTIEAAVRSGAIKSEVDAALLIERECRIAGCEGTGFETISAGPGRSFGIHAFPSYGSGPFGSDGMTILDFGIKLEGYTTDVTMTFLRGELGSDRERMIALVHKARDAAVAKIAPGLPTRGAALAVDEVFAKEGLSMPHSLGHGIGLEAHEGPPVRSREDNTAVFEVGHVVAIEPGLYDPELGGVRLEDDYLVTETGCEKLTNSRIVRL